MAQGILEFELPEEDREFMLAKRGGEWASTLWEVDRRIRDWLKYGGDTLDSADAALEKVREWIREEMQGSNLTFDDLN